MSGPLIWTGAQVTCLHCGQAGVPTWTPTSGCWLMPYHAHPADGTRCVGSYAAVEK